MATARLPGGITLTYEIHGSADAPPLVLIMGMGGQLTDWPPQFVDRLARSFRVVLFDNRDIGLSSESSGLRSGPTAVVKTLVSRILPGRRFRAPYTLADLAADVVGLLDHLGIDSAHVVGMSMGGMVAQQLTIDHPGRVRSLTSIMASTGSIRSGRPKVLVLAAMIFDAVRIDTTPKHGVDGREKLADDLVVWYRKLSGPSRDEADFRAVTLRSIERSWRPGVVFGQVSAVLASADRTPDLGRVEAPTLVIHGLVDPLVQPSGGIATALAVPGSRLLAFPDMGHDLPRPRLDEIASAIEDLARRAEGEMSNRAEGEMSDRAEGDISGRAEGRADHPVDRPPTDPLQAGTGIGHP